MDIGLATRILLESTDEIGPSNRHPSLAIRPPARSAAFIDSLQNTIEVGFKVR
jgi:hypothetical protein